MAFVATVVALLPIEAHADPDLDGVRSMTFVRTDGFTKVCRGFRLDIGYDGMANYTDTCNGHPHGDHSGKITEKERAELFTIVKTLDWDHPTTEMLSIQDSGSTTLTVTYAGATLSADIQFPSAQFARVFTMLDAIAKRVIAAPENAASQK